MPDGRAGASCWGILGAEQSVMQPQLRRHVGFPPRQWAGGMGRTGESTGALSCLAWNETEVCTHLPTLQPPESTSSDVWEVSSMEQNLWELHWSEPRIQ